MFDTQLVWLYYLWGFVLLEQKLVVCEVRPSWEQPIHPVRVFGCYCAGKGMVQLGLAK